MFNIYKAQGRILTIAKTKTFAGNNVVYKKGYKGYYRAYKKLTVVSMKTYFTVQV